MGNTQKKFFLQKKEIINFKGLGNILLITNNYIISKSHKKILNIFDIQKNRSKTIKYNGTDFIIKFHPKFENVFLFANGNTTKIIEIIKDTFELKERIEVKGHTQQIKIAEFSKTDNKIFVTYSLDNTIKIWDINKAFCICNIPLTNLILDIQIYNNFIFYFDDDEPEIIKYDYSKFNLISSLKVNASKFIVLNEEKLALIEGNSIYILKNNKLENFKGLKECYNNIFYDEKLGLLYLICFYSFDILDSKNLETIYSQKINEKVINIFFSNKIQEVNIYANFIFLCLKNIQIYSLYSADNICKKEFINLLFPENTFWDRVIPNISDIANLQWETNLNEEIVETKEYLNMKIISDAIDSNYKKSLNIKKLEVINELKSKDFDKNDYIKIINLLIKDNTNKDLIIIYLKCLENLKDNTKDMELKNIKIESFQNEYEHYKIMFTNNKLKSDGFIGKEFSEKDKFINLLKRIYLLEYEDTNKLEIFKKDVDDTLKTLQLFNQPINLSNEELYWYRNTFVVYFSLKDILKKINKLELMKECIKNILDKDLFNKKYILENKELLTSIITLIAIPQSSKNFQFNINLIESKDPNYDYKKESEFKKLIKCTQKGISGYFFNYNYKDYFLNEPSSTDLCFNNFILNIKQNMNLEEYEQKNYDKIKEYFNEIIDFTRMQKFLAKIFCSKTFKQAFNILYPKYFNFPFKDENDAYIFLEEYYRFIPFKSDQTGAITEKFSLEIYFLLKKRKLSLPDNTTDEINNLSKKIFYRGLCVKTSCHEINHEFYNLLLMHSNGLIPVETPRKIFIGEREGGKNMERLLFNQPMGNLSLKECLYLLNEKNYEKELKDFKKGFNELNKKDLKFENDNIFFELNEIFKAKNFPELEAKGFIKCEENDDNSDIFSNSYIVDVEDVNDVLGFIREPEKL